MSCVYTHRARRVKRHDQHRRRRTIEKGVPANFFVYYEIDDDESKHALSLDEYGQKEATNAWVLLRADT